MKHCHQALLSLIFVLQRKGSETESTGFYTDRTNLTAFEVSFRDNFFPHDLFWFRCMISPDVSLSVLSWDRGFLVVLLQLMVCLQLC